MCVVGAGRGADVQNSVPILPALRLCEAVRVLSSNRLVLCMHTHTLTRLTFEICSLASNSLEREGYKYHSKSFSNCAESLLCQK